MDSIERTTCSICERADPAAPTGPSGLATRIGPPVVLILLLCLAYAPLLRPPRFAFEDDDLEYAVPFASWILREAGSGHFPLWNPHTDCGIPTLVQPPYMGPLYPLFGLFALVPPGWALNLGYLIHILWAGLGCYLLCRRWGVSGWPAAAGAFAFSVSSSFSVSLNRGYLHHLVALSYTPWLWLCVEWLAARRGAPRWTRAVAVGGLFLGLLFLGGHTVSALSGTLLFSLYAGLSLVGIWADRGARTGRGIAAILIGAAAIALLGLLLSAPQLLPLEEMKHQSALEGGRGFQPWDRELAAPWRKLSYVLPAWRAGEKGTDAMGLAAVLLAGAGLAGLGARGWTTLVGTGLLALFLSMGPHAFVLPLLQRIFPPARIISYSYFFSVGAQVCLAVLAARGIEGLRRVEGWRWRGAVLGTLGFLVICLLSGMRQILGDGAARDSLPQSLFQDTLVLLGVVALATRSGHPVKLGRRCVPVALACLLLVADAGATRARTIGAMPKPPFSFERYFAESAITRRVAEDPGAFRIFHHERGREPGLWALRRNGGLVHGYEEIEAGTRLTWGRYRELEDSFEGFTIGWQEGLREAEKSDAGRAGKLAITARDARLLRLLGVKYIVADADLTGEGSEQFGRVIAEGEVRLFRAFDPLPLYRLVPAVQWAKDGDEAFAEVLKPGEDPGAVAVVEAGGTTVIQNGVEKPGTMTDFPRLDDCELRDSAGGEPTNDRVTIVSREPDRVVLRTGQCGSGYLIAAQANLPGWRARVDGKEVTIRAANFLFQGVPVGAGIHEVALEYRSPGFRIGLFAALVGGIGSLALALAGKRRALP